MMQPEQLQQLVSDALDDIKAVDTSVIDVHELTSVTDFMVIASGTSNRHVKSIADKVLEKVKAKGVKPLGMEGEDVGEWILIDLVDVVVHIMLPKVRDFYNLEKLWSMEVDTHSGEQA